MTATFIFVILGLILLFELFAWWTQKVDTISEQMRKWQLRYPFLVWATIYVFGVLTGHFYWPL